MLPASPNFRAKERAISHFLIFGASSGTGLHIARQLADRGDAVTAFVRPTSNRSELESHRATLIVGDALDPASVSAAFAEHSFDAVICTVGTQPGQSNTDFETNRNIIDATVKSGTRRLIVLTTIGAGDSWDVMAPGAQEFLGDIIRLKTKIEEYLAQQDLDYTIIRPGGLQNSPATGRGVRTEDHTVGGLISRDDLARLTVACLDDDATIGRTYHAFDPNATHN